MRTVSRLRGRTTVHSAPTLSYFLCGTPRSGTTLLAEMLASTRLVGRAGEYFSPTNEPSGAGADYAAYVSNCVRGNSRNRIFGAKLLWGHTEDFLGKLRSLSGRKELSDRGVLESVFPDPRFIWISRADVVAQAVSWSKAAQTGEFYVGDPRRTGTAPVFDYEVIRRLVGQLIESNESWRRWFTANGIEPFSISYEELVADTKGRTRQALRFLGLEPPPGLRITEQTVRQANAINEEWIARYHELTALQGP